jgi:hypothetical protein
MFHLPHVDPVIVPVRTNPLDPDDALLEIDGYNKSVTVALDVENDPSISPVCKSLPIGQTTPGRKICSVKTGDRDGRLGRTSH